MTDATQPDSAPPVPAPPVPALPETGQAPAQWPAAPPGVPVEGAPSAPPGALLYPPAAGGPARASTSSNAIIALILSVASWVICPIIPAVVALVFASMATKEIEASGGRVEGTGMVTAAKVVSWINIGLFAAFIVIGAFVLVLVAIAGGLNRTG